MFIFFRVLSAAYIAGIFLLADLAMVSDVAPFNPFSLLHIPLYGILTLLLILSFPLQRKKFINPTNSTNLSREMRSLFHWDSTNSINPSNLVAAGIIALVVAMADEIHQAYLPNRNASFIDVLLDVIGIVLSILVLRQIQEIPGWWKKMKFLRRIE